MKTGAFASVFLIADKITYCALNPYLETPRGNHPKYSKTPGFMPGVYS
jgi:hypothetical protein